MAAEPKPKAAAKKKRRRAPREEFVDYVVEIEGWDWGYSLSLNTEKHPVDPALKVMGGRNTERYHLDCATTVAKYRPRICSEPGETVASRRKLSIHHPSLLHKQAHQFGLAS